ncbi:MULTISPECIES: threonine synthase [Dactylosporangium]|uniref:Threonine synthase n=2 Tax=Dactylosporangium TaxID=35753 RepID=A0A9W6NJE2_9ACTN|nr:MULTISPECIES: threonine synthase [Dactylosporangium]UAB97138.1 threonine synthase [Dactylosporangium vinaceum]UWZ45425.1 threonine synthase [Dactylosporangium matsuzakiense]GLK98586.1 threonine synthase [Dactylosporangium matsuzakiense]
MTSTLSVFTDSPARNLVCRGCGATFPLAAQHACYECFGPLEVGYDTEALARVTREQIEAGPKNIWRYAPLLPVGVDPATRVTLDPGLTPLVRADGLGRELGFTAPLYVKDDSANPTHSFKDRVVSVALTAAKALGFTRYSCASTGNLANSVAAHAARAGVPSTVFIPADLEPGKIVMTAVYGGEVVAIEGSYDEVNRLCSELTETDEFEDTAFVNVNVRPFYAEGSKTLGYEVAEQLGWRIPAQVVIPMASGELLTKIDKAFAELVEIGLVPPSEWKVFGAQSAGCNPIATALHDGRDDIIPVKPTGIAKSLNIGDPAAGVYALESVRRTGGWMEYVDDDEIRAGIQLLARTTGVYAETAGGVTTAVLKKLVESGRLDPNAETVVFNTGDGLKTLDAVADRVGPTHRVKPSLKSAREAGLLG